MTHSEVGEQEKVSILKDSIFLTRASIIAKIAGLLSALLIPRFLGPTLYGFLSTLLLITAYTTYLDLGALNGLSREYPLLKKQKKLFELSKHISTSTTFFLGLTIVASIALWFTAYLFKNQFSPEFILGLKVMSVVIIFQTLIQTINTIIRSEANFTLLSKITIARAAIYSITSVILAYLFQLNGVVIALLFTNIMLFLYLWITIKPLHDSHFAINPEILRKLMAVGIPMHIAAFFLVAFHSLDKLTILGLLSSKELGFYALAMGFSEYIVLFPMTISTIFSPRIYSVNPQQPRNFLKYLSQPLILIAADTATAIGLMYLAIPLAINLVYPEFAASEILSYILLWSNYFIALSFIPAFMFVSLNKQFRQIAIQAITLGVLLLAAFISILKWGIVGAAWAKLIASAFYGIAIVLLISALCKSQKKETASLLTKLILIFIYTAGTTFIITKFIQSPITLKEIFYSTIFKEVTFLIALIPLWWYVNKETKVLRYVKNILLKKI